jgi:hypothetical protein
VPPTEPVEEGDEGVWDPVGEPAGSRSPAPTGEELLAQLERQPPAPEESRVPAAAAVGEMEAAGTQETSAPAAATVKDAVVEEAEEETAAGSMDITSRRVAFCSRLLGSPPKRTLTVFSGSWKSSLSLSFFLPF